MPDIAFQFSEPALKRLDLLAARKKRTRVETLRKALELYDHALEAERFGGRVLLEVPDDEGGGLKHVDIATRIGGL